MNLFENSEEIEVRSESPVNKSLNSDQLRNLLQHNRQYISHNLSSAEKLKVEAEATYNKMTNLYGYHMNKLTTSQQEVVESNL